MRRFRTLRLATAASVAALLSTAASAQNCAGFTDVLASSAFCPSVEWMKNRQVTTGCGAGTTYCPNDPVTRLSMAAFMKRLGEALTPVDLPVIIGAPAALQSPAGNPVYCSSGDYAVTGFPRRAYVRTSVILAVPSAGTDISATVVYSTNAGVSWNDIPNTDQYTTLYPGASPGNQSTLTPFGALDLNVGQSVRFGVQLGQFAGSGTVTVACTNRVQIANRNGATSPFDVQPAVVSRGAGS